MGWGRDESRDRQRNYLISNVNPRTPGLLFESGNGLRRDRLGLRDGCDGSPAVGEREVDPSVAVRFVGDARPGEPHTRVSK